MSSNVASHIARALARTTGALKPMVVFTQAYIIPALLGWITMKIFYLLWLHPLANVPGPRVAALTDLWKTYHVHKGRYTSTLHEQHVKYGDAVRIGPNEVSLVAPDDVKTIYGLKTRFTKGPLYDAFNIGGTGLVSERNPELHAIRRGAVAPAFAVRYIATLEQFCDGCTELLMRNFDKIAESSPVVDLSEHMGWYAYDCISGIAFGKFLGLLENMADKEGLLDMLGDAAHTMFISATLSSFSWVLPTRLGSLLSSLLGNRNGVIFLRKYAAEIVTDRQAIRETNPAVYEEKKDMLYYLMEASYASTSELINAKSPSLARNALSLIFAGADTTKNTMVSFLTNVYSHPASIEKLRKEMDAAIAAGNLSFPINYNQAARLEFLSACIKEAMRLDPAFGFTLQRVVPEGGSVLGGRFYREGTLVGMSAREIHRDPRAYGKDAHHWRPERWLEGDRNELEKVSLAFGQGTRICVGKHIATMEMTKLLPTIVYHYDIIIKNPKNPWRSNESFFVEHLDFFCTVKKRDVS